MIIFNTILIGLIVMLVVYAICCTITIAVERKENIEITKRWREENHKNYNTLINLTEVVKKDLIKNDINKNINKVKNNISVDSTGIKTMKLYPIKTSDKAITISWKDKDR